MRRPSISGSFKTRRFDGIRRATDRAQVALLAMEKGDIAMLLNRRPNPFTGYGTMETDTAEGRREEV